VRRARGLHKRQELLAQISKDYRPEELAWGGPRGKERW